MNPEPNSTVQSAESSPPPAATQPTSDVAPATVPPPDTAQQPLAASQRGRLDAAAKLEVLHLVSIGFTITAAAKRVGCSRRTIYATANRDSEFKRRLECNREDTHKFSLETLKEIAQEKKTCKAIELLMQFVYPERSRRGGRAPSLAQLKAMLSQIVTVIDGAVIDEPTRERIRNGLAPILGNLSSPPRRLLE